LASTGEEGRATCEKLRRTGRGEDPEMSEWGNPVGVMPHHLHLNP
jgi:hypothetical protein